MYNSLKNTRLCVSQRCQINPKVISNPDQMSEHKKHDTVSLNKLIDNLDLYGLRQLYSDTCVGQMVDTMKKIKQDFNRLIDEEIEYIDKYFAKVFRKEDSVLEQMEIYLRYGCFDTLFQSLNDYQGSFDFLDDLDDYQRQLQIVLGTVSRKSYQYIMDQFMNVIFTKERYHKGIIPKKNEIIEQRDIDQINKINQINQGNFNETITSQPDVEQRQLKMELDKSTTELNVDAKHPLNIQSICKLDKLKVLTMNYSKCFIEDISYLEQLRSLIELSSLNLQFQNNTIKSISCLTQLRSLTGLTELGLNLSSNKINDISPIRALKDLHQLTWLELKISKNSIVDISPLGELKSLLELKSLTLWMQQNKIKDITILSEIKYLTELRQLELRVQKNQIEDCSSFRDLKTLVRLRDLDINISVNQLDDMTPFSEFKHLIELKKIRLMLPNNRFQSIAPLSELRSLVSLTSVEIENNKISDAYLLSGLGLINSLTQVLIKLGAKKKIKNKAQLIQFSRRHYS